MWHYGQKWPTSSIYGLIQSLVLPELRVHPFTNPEVPESVIIVPGHLPVIRHLEADDMRPVIFADFSSAELLFSYGIL